MGAEADHFLRGLRVSADRLAVGIEALEDAHGLKEVKPVSFLEKDLL
jgi:hypothetical protein